MNFWKMKSNFFLFQLIAWKKFIEIWRKRAIFIRFFRRNILRSSSCSLRKKKAKKIIYCKLILKNSNLFFILIKCLFMKYAKVFLKIDEICIFLLCLFKRNPDFSWNCFVFQTDEWWNDAMSEVSLFFL